MVVVLLLFVSELFQPFPAGQPHLAVGHHLHLQHHHVPHTGKVGGQAGVLHDGVCQELAG